jgi:hypothetical protein
MTMIAYDNGRLGDVTTVTGCVLDDAYDSTYASDGVSRYGAYLAQHRAKFQDAREDGVTEDRRTFAAAAWQVATEYMSPTYVALHPRIQSADCAWDENGNLAIAVVIATSAGRILPGARGWVRESLSQSWYDPENSGVLMVLPSLLVRVPIRPSDVPKPIYHDGIPVVGTAKAAVRSVCDVLNPVLAQVLHA